MILRWLAAVSAPFVVFWSIVVMIAIIVQNRYKFTDSMTHITPPWNPMNSGCFIPWLSPGHGTYVKSGTTQANLALTISINLYLHDRTPHSGHVDSTESLPIIYLLPRHATVSLKSGTNQIRPIIRSLTGDNRQ